MLPRFQNVAVVIVVTFRLRALGAQDNLVGDDAAVRRRRVRERLTESNLEHQPATSKLMLELRVTKSVRLKRSYDCKRWIIREALN